MASKRINIYIYIYIYIYRREAESTQQIAVRNPGPKHDEQADKIYIYIAERWNRHKQIAIRSPGPKHGEQADKNKYIYISPRGGIDASR
jgi:hypothetical protein